MSSPSNAPVKSPSKVRKIISLVVALVAAVGILALTAGVTLMSGTKANQNFQFVGTPSKIK